MEFSIRDAVIRRAIKGWLEARTKIEIVFRAILSGTASSLHCVSRVAARLEGQFKRAFR